MYTKQEASKIRQEFWTTFGRYMAPVVSADGEKVNWINYKTGEPQIAFKMDADNNRATVGVVFSHADDGIRALYYEQMRELQKMLPADEQYPWIYTENQRDEYGRQTAAVYRRVEGVNIFQRNDWPVLISFFKSGILALDEFWSMGRYAFESLR
jgi:hypothetical protein